MDIVVIVAKMMKVGTPKIAPGAIMTVATPKIAPETASMKHQRRKTRLAEKDLRNKKCLKLI